MRYLGVNMYLKVTKKGLFVDRKRANIYWLFSTLPSQKGKQYIQNTLSLSGYFVIKHCKIHLLVQEQSNRLTF
jgi:hypothetical protein